MTSSFPAGIRALLTGTALAVLAATSPALAHEGDHAADHPLAGSTEHTEDARLNAFLEESYRRELERDPTTRTQLGMPGDHSRWTLKTEAYQQETVRLAEAELKRLRTEFDPAKLSPTARVSFRLQEYRLQEQIDLFPYRWQSFATTQLTGTHSVAPAFLINYHQIRTRKDAEDYIARLRGLPELLDVTVENVRARAEKGMLPQAFQFPLIIDASKGVLTGRPFDSGAEDSPLLADFKTKVSALDLPAPDKAALVTAAEAALRDHVAPAYRRHIQAMEGFAKQASRDDGVWALPDGDAFYRSQVRQMTTLELEPEHIHRIGLMEVERLHEEMRGIMRQVGFKGDLAAFFKMLRTDARFHKPNTDQGRAEYLAMAVAYIDRMEDRLDQLFLTKPKAPIVVKRVEPFREQSSATAFYEPPSPDGSRPGTFYVSLYDMANVSTYELEALAYHEGIPGHHMQMAIAQELEDLPTFRKFMWLDAYGEGWGLYAERLPKEMGFYKDPYSDAGRISLELWRAARLVVDTGLHYKRWTREQAIQWLKDNTPTSDGLAVGAINRYLAVPAQALSYKIGMEKILELREKAQHELGDRFDIRVFHDTILRNGSVPLPILEELIDGYIASAKTGRG